MHVFHQQLPVIEDMDAADLVAWGKDAAALLRAIHKTKACPLLG
jgi:hypothetical protein